MLLPCAARVACLYDTPLLLLSDCAPPRALSLCRSLSLAQRLVSPFRMSGQHKLWKLEKQVYTGAADALVPVAQPARTRVDFAAVVSSSGTA